MITLVVLLALCLLGAAAIGATAREVARDGHRPIATDPLRVAHRGRDTED
jgi:hypothetical protein